MDFLCRPQYKRVRNRKRRQCAAFLPEAMKNFDPFQGFTERNGEKNCLTPFSVKFRRLGGQENLGGGS